MSASMLKKEFSKSTVQRMRNIITGNQGDRTQVQTGYEKYIDEYKEGEVWEEKGKKWTIKNGIKQTVTKIDNIKKMAMLPITCPNCKKAFKIYDANKKMYAIKGMCLDCVAEQETKIKIEGKWEEYKSDIINSNKNATLQDFELALESWMQENNTFVTENGDVEDWTKVDKTKVYAEIKSNIEKLKNTRI
jgi:hypothetical protein